MFGLQVVVLELAPQPGKSCLFSANRSSCSLVNQCSPLETISQTAHCGPLRRSDVEIAALVEEPQSRQPKSGRGDTGDTLQARPLRLHPRNQHAILKDLASRLFGAWYVCSSVKHVPRRQLSDSSLDLPVAIYFFNDAYGAATNLARDECHFAHRSLPQFFCRLLRESPALVGKWMEATQAWDSASKNLKYSLTFGNNE